MKTYNYGVYPTMITPYKADGSVDLTTAGKYVEWYAQKGCDGIFAVCQSSEIQFLSVEERVALNRTVYRKVQEVNRTAPRPLTVVSSGHVADSIEAQAEELNRIYDSGTDALILITNRLDLHNEGDDVWIANAEKLLQKLPQDVGLGLYECPAPYKRLVTPKILDWCLSTGRFYFMKDTCCDAALLQKRLEQLRGTQFKLLNANCQTLLSSLQNGAAGYCGILANFHPQLYGWLCRNFEKDPATAEVVQALLGSLGFTESGLPYPLSAKYHMGLEGIPTENHARNRSAEDLTPYAMDSVRQIKTLCDHFTDWLENQ